MIISNTFNGIHSVGKSRFLSGHVGYNLEMMGNVWVRKGLKYHGYVPENGRKDEDTDEEVPGDEAELVVVVWLGQRRLSDLGEGQGGPVEAVTVLRGQRRIPL